MFIVNVGGITMRRFLLASIILMVVLSHAIIHTAAEETQKEVNPDLAPDAKSAILIERDTGTLLYDKNAHEELPPASMTKTMTLLLIMEELEKGNLTLEEEVRISEEAASMGGSQIFLEAGEEMSVENLIKGIAVASGNDASVALAERISGSEEAFVKKMNEKVNELELEHTHFQNASGLPAEDHYSTSYDMAMIAKELLKYESITEYTSIYEDYLREGTDEEFWLVNTNKLVKFYPGVDGLKTGFTNEAKYCLTATAKKDDMRVVAVVMGAETVKERNASISKMLDYAFEQYDTNHLFEKGEVVESLENIKASKKSLPIVTSESISTIQKKGASTDDISTTFVLNKGDQLPLKQGDEVGSLIVKKEDEVLLESPLIIEEDVEDATLLTLLYRSMERIVK